MDFKHLTVERCPSCSAPPYQEGIEVDWGKNAGFQTHVNGQRWEWRQFLCGCRVGWVPNFERAEVMRGYECRNSPEVKAKELKRESAAKRLRAFIDTLDVDNAYKRDIVFPGRSTDYP